MMLPFINTQRKIRHLLRRVDRIRHDERNIVAAHVFIASEPRFAGPVQLRILAHNCNDIVLVGLAIGNGPAARAAFFSVRITHRPVIPVAFQRGRLARVPTDRFRCQRKFIRAVASNLLLQTSKNSAYRDSMPFTWMHPLPGARPERREVKPGRHGRQQPVRLVYQRGDQVLSLLKGREEIRGIALFFLHQAGRPGWYNQSTISIRQFASVSSKREASVSGSMFQ